MQKAQSTGAQQVSASQIQSLNLPPTMIPNTITLPKYPASPLYIMTSIPLNRRDIKIIKDNVDIVDGDIVTQENMNTLLSCKYIISLSPIQVAQSFLPGGQMPEAAFDNIKTQLEHLSPENAKSEFLKKTIELLKTIGGDKKDTIKRLLDNVLALTGLKIPDEVVTHDDIASKLSLKIIFASETSEYFTYEGQDNFITTVNSANLVLNKHKIYEVFSLKFGLSLTRILDSLSPHYKFKEVCAGKGLLSAVIKAAGYKGEWESTDIDPPNKEDCFPGVTVTRYNAKRLPTVNPCSTIYLMAQPTLTVLLSILEAKEPRVILQTGNTFKASIQALSNKDVLYFINLNIDNYRKIHDRCGVRLLIKGDSSHYYQILGLIPKDLIGTHGELVVPKDTTGRKPKHKKGKKS